MSFWSVVQTESRREHVAEKFLQLDDFEIYFPKTVMLRGASERVMPLFPGYLFVEIIDRWWSVRWTTGVIRLLMIDDRPAKVPGEMLETIRSSEGIDGLVRLKPKPKPRGLQKGDRVRVTHGSMEGRTGVYQGQSGSQRSRILLNLLGREVKTMVPTCAVTRIELPLQV